MHALCITISQFGLAFVIFTRKGVSRPRCRPRSCRRLCIACFLWPSCSCVPCRKLKGGGDPLPRGPSIRRALCPERVRSKHIDINYSSLLVCGSSWGPCRCLITSLRPPRCILGASLVHPWCILGASLVHPWCILGASSHPLPWLQAPAGAPNIV